MHILLGLIFFERAKLLRSFTHRRESTQDVLPFVVGSEGPLSRASSNASTVIESKEAGMFGKGFGRQGEKKAAFDGEFCFSL